MSPDIEKNNISANSRYRLEIDGLRAFAVVAVIINHFNKEILPNGYLGVDIFFVISGFVITSSLYQRPSKNFKDFISGFYERRIKRLVPALSVFVLITSFTICLFNPTSGFSLRTGLTSLFGLSNLYLLKQSTDYFAQSTDLKVFTHTWSLGVEEQFYILFPFLIWFSGFGRHTKNGARNLFLIIGSLAIASLIGFLYLYETNQPAAYFLMPTRFWEIAAGSLLFITFQKRASLEKFLEKVPPLLVLGLIVGIMYLPMSLATTSTVMVVVLSLVLIASLKKGTASYTFFTHPKVVYIGLISYSLYLWHWGVLSISRWTIGIHWWSVPFQLGLMFGLAICSYRYIETPLRKGNWFGKRWKTIIVGGGVILGLSGGLVLKNRFKIIGYSPSQWLYLLSNNKRSFNIQREWGHRKNSEEVQKLAKCHFSKPLSNMEFLSCISTSKNQKSTKGNIYIFGDSHAANYVFGFRKAFPNRVSMATVGHGCGFISTNDAKKFDSAKMNCTEYINYVRNFVRNSVSEGDFVVIGNDWRRDSPKKKSNQMFNALLDLSLVTNSKGAHFILLDDVPDVGNPLLLSKTWYRPFPITDKIKIEEINNLQKDLDIIGNQISDLSPLSHYLSLRHLLCEEKFCSNFREDKSMYFNHGHITSEVSESLSLYIKNYLEELEKS